MPITEPSQFTNTKSTGNVKRFIVSLTNGSDTFLIGNFAGHFTDGEVLYLVDNFSMSSGVDLFQDTFQRSIVTFTIDNTIYKQDSSGGIRFADQIGDIVSEAASIYVTADENTNSLSDCLQIYKGITRSVGKANEETVTVQIEDNGFLLDKLLLIRTVKDAIRSTL